MSTDQWVKKTAARLMDLYGARASGRARENAEKDRAEFRGRWLVVAAEIERAVPAEHADAVNDEMEDCNE